MLSGFIISPLEAVFGNHARLPYPDRDLHCCCFCNVGNYSHELSPRLLDLMPIYIRGSQNLGTKAFLFKDTLHKNHRTSLTEDLRCQLKKLRNKELKQRKRRKILGRLRRSGVLMPRKGRRMLGRPLLEKEIPRKGGESRE